MSLDSFSDRLLLSLFMVSILGTYSKSLTLGGLYLIVLLLGGLNVNQDAWLACTAIWLFSVAMRSALKAVI